MTHIVYIDSSSERDAYPLWFNNAVHEASQLARENQDEFWTWAWNRKHCSKVKLRDRQFQIHFNSEPEFTMFALRYS
jgi:hypothetical protein